MKKIKDHKIYIVLSYSGTFLSRIIKAYTRGEFSHVSISLDENLDRMYSFGRLNPYNPLFAGFVKEGINFGTFKRFKNTLTEIYSLELTKSQYDKIEKCIENMKESQVSYKFNIVGLIANAFNIKYRSKNSFYCAEFLKYLIEEAGLEMELPELIKPMDFRKPEMMKLEYRGLLRLYRSEKNNKTI